MKILQIVHGFPPECLGGTETYVLGLCRELRGLGHEVQVLCGSHTGAGPGAPLPKLVTSEFEGFTVHRLHRTGLYVDNWEKGLAPEVEPLVDSVLRDFQPDLVHVHHWIRLSRHLVEICHDHGIPAVCTLHDLVSTCPRAFRVREDMFCERELGPKNCLGCAPAGEFMSEEDQRKELVLYHDDFKNELELARRLIVPSVAHREALLKHLPGLEGKFRVVPHGNVSSLTKRPGPASSFPEEPLRIGHWGHLSRLKGIDILLKAVRDCRHADRIQLEVFGNVVFPDERAEIDELSKGLKVTWHGAYTPRDLGDIPFDVAVIPSRCSESWSFVLDEAFLLGVPAIVPDRGALGERLNGAGATYRADDEKDLARVFSEIFRKPSQIAAWRQRIPSLPRIQDHSRQVLAVYRDVTTSSARLPTTPRLLRARRLQVKAWNLESRNRQLEENQWRISNLETDLFRAQASMEEMNFYHVEKDKELARLKREVAALAAALTSGAASHAPTAPPPKDEALGVALAEKAAAQARLCERLSAVAIVEGHLADAHRLAEKRQLQMSVGSARVDALQAQISGLHARITAMLAEQSAAELRDQEIRKIVKISEQLQVEREAVRHLRLTLADERQKLQEAEATGVRLEERMRNLGTSLISAVRDAESQLPGGASFVRTVSDGTLRGEIDRADVEVKRLLDHAIDREKEFAASISQRDQVIARLGTTVDGLLDALQAAERRRRTATPQKARSIGSRLRILMVVHQYLPKHVAGTEIYTRNLARELSQRHDVAILTTESDHSRPRFEKSLHTFDGLRVHQVIHNYVWEGFRETYDCPEADALFRQVLTDERPDIVHIQHLHFWSANFVTIAKTRGIPVVYTLHDYGLLCPRDGQMRRHDGELCRVPQTTKCGECIAHHQVSGPATPSLPRALLPGADVLIDPEIADLLRRMRQMDKPPLTSHEAAITERLDYLQRTLKDVDLFISPSEFLRKTFTESGLITGDRIVVSDNGYDTSNFTNFQRTSQAGSLRITYIGTIADYKGVHVLVDAMNGIDDPRVSCRIWGEVAAFMEYTEHLRSRITNPRTFLMGSCPPERVAEVFANTDVLVIPSLWWENSPLTAREASLAGVPVLASDLGGLAESVKHEVTGLHFRAGDALDLRAKILSLLDPNGPLARMNPRALKVKPIAEDARDMEARYLRVLERLGTISVP